MKFTEHSNTLGDGATREARKLIKNSNNLQELVLGWGASKDRELQLGTGVDDNDLHRYMWITLKDGDGEKLEGFMTLEEVYSLYPTAKPFTEFISLNEQSDWKQLEVDQEKLSAYLQYDISDCYNDELASPLIKLDRAIALLLSYAISDGGGVSITFDSSESEYIDLSAVGCSELGRVGLDYFSPKPIGGIQPGLGEIVYIDLSQ